MVIFDNDIITTTFRYKVSVFSVERQEKSQIEYSCIIYKSATSANIWPPLPPPIVEYLFSLPTVDSVPASLMVPVTNHPGTFLIVVVNTSAGGTDGWFFFYSPVLYDVMMDPMLGFSTSLSCWGRVQFSAELEEFVGRFSKFPEGVIWLIISFIASDSYVICPFLAELCS